MACKGMGCMGNFRRPRYLMGGDLAGTTTETLVETIASVSPEITADALVTTGQAMYAQGYSTGQTSGLLYGALIGAGLLLLLK